MYITIDGIINSYKNQNYVLFDGFSKKINKIIDYDLNIFGIRTNNIVANKFDDYIGIIWRSENGSWNLNYFPGTTDPGTYWLNNPMNVNGTAILVPGQYLRSHGVGLHKREYLALTQISPLKVYRDNNKDNILDFVVSKIESGMHGINIHHASNIRVSENVDKWSAACQVIQKINDFDIFMKICQNGKKNWGNKFTYTLFTEDQIIQ